MLQLVKRSSNQQFLPGGALNPCPETAPFCLLIENIRQNPAASQRLSASLIAGGLVGGQFIGGIPGAAGLGVVGVGAPGDGVRGIAGGAAPSGHGVAGFTGSVNHAGVLGETTVAGVGVRGRSSNQAVRGDGGTFGVVGSGMATGVDGTGTGAIGFGVVGRGTATGVDGTATGATSFGVVGRGATTGVHGTGTGAASVGVMGRGSVTGTVGRGVGAGTVGVVGVGGAVGVRGDGPGDTSGIGVEGIPGPISGGFIPFAGAFRGSVLVERNLDVNGDLFVTGFKSAVVPHPDGSRRAMYAVEAPESWFEDIGRGQLRQGAARVDVDPDFAAVTGLGDDYHVFLTPEGPSNGLYIADRSSSGFEVREQGDGTSDISFSYRIITPRTDMRAGRLQTVERPPSGAGEPVDPMSPELPVPPPAASPDEPTVEPEGTPPAESHHEWDASQRPPSDWPVDTVPWPPDIVADHGGR
jgi:hypothetical protein